MRLTCLSSILCATRTTTVYFALFTVKNESIRIFTNTCLTFDTMIYSLVGPTSKIKPTNLMPKTVNPGFHIRPFLTSFLDLSRPWVFLGFYSWVIFKMSNTCVRQDWILKKWQLKDEYFNSAWDSNECDERE